MINAIFKREVTSGIEPPNFKAYYMITTGIFLGMSLLICWRLKIIMKNINKAFGEGFEEQTFWLRLTMATFVFTYVFRSVTEVLKFFGKWPDVFYTLDLSFTESLLYVYQYFLYNNVPIGMILILHHKNFRAQKQTTK